MYQVCIDWQPRVLLGMVEARSVNVKKTTTVLQYTRVQVSNIIRCVALPTLQQRRFGPASDTPEKSCSDSGDAERDFPRREGFPSAGRI